MRKLALALAAVTALSAPAPASAATQIVNGSGQLTGATGVNVGGVLYDVTFAEGSCAGLFSGCNASSDFSFHNLTDATAAAQALLDEVFVDTLAGNFDTDPSLTFGCATASALGCSATIPYFANIATYSEASALNGILDGVFPGSLANPSADSTQSANRVFALFALSATQLLGVPEPASWAMMILGFGAVGSVLRRRRVAAIA